MKASLEETLVDVWRQALVENAGEVQIGEKNYPVQRTSRKHLREVVFPFDGKEIRAIEQNPETKSRWAQMARAGKKVMQFISEGGYLANVVDGKLTLYGKSAGKRRGERA
jgi:hypothetical protein